MPNDHTYGMKTQKEDYNLNDILKLKYVNDEKPDLLLNVEKDYKPELLHNRLKPPRPTIASKLRQIKTEKRLELSQSAKNFARTMTSFKPSLNRKSLDEK